MVIEFQPITGIEGPQKLIHELNFEGDGGSTSVLVPIKKVVEEPPVQDYKGPEIRIKT